MGDPFQYILSADDDAKQEDKQAHGCASGALSARPVHKRVTLARWALHLQNALRGLAKGLPHRLP